LSEFFPAVKLIKEYILKLKVDRFSRKNTRSPVKSIHFSRKNENLEKVNDNINNWNFRLNHVQVIRALQLKLVTLTTFPFSSQKLCFWKSGLTKKVLDTSQKAMSKLDVDDKYAKSF